MEYRQLGSSGLTVSIVGVGCNNFGFGAGLDAGETNAVVEAALEEGINFFDTADIYGESEAFLGKALQGRRDQVVLATKFGKDMGGRNGPGLLERASRQYIRRAVVRSLGQLRTDWIDLYQLHEPSEKVPIEETLGTLTDLVREGLVRYVGCSNFATWQVVEASWTARTAGTTSFISAQNEYSLLNRAVEESLVPVCLKYALGVIPYYPLANGLLTGKYQRDAPSPPGSRLADPEMASWLSPQNWTIVERLDHFAASRGVTLLDVAVGGLAARPAVVSVIAGATAPQQVRKNARAGSWKPTQEDAEALRELLTSDTASEPVKEAP